jgi:hypothetical protein
MRKRKFLKTKKNAAGTYNETCKKYLQRGFSKIST